jgi:hypothetical protein
MKYCPGCDYDLPDSEFHKNKRERDGLQTRCKQCVSDYGKNNREMFARYDANRQQRRRTWIEAQKNKPCPDCAAEGRNPIWVPVAMQFDHVEGKKIMDIARMMRAHWSLDRVAEEIAKCELVCSNHHAIRTWHERDQHWLKPKYDRSTWGGQIGQA